MMGGMSVQLLPVATEVRPGETLAFAVVNTGSSGVSFGAAYSLERDDDGGWSRCNVEEAWVAALLLLGPGKRSELVARLPKDAAPGRYRVVKDIQTAEGHVEVTFEFNVIVGAPPR